MEQKKSSRSSLEASKGGRRGVCVWVCVYTRVCVRDSETPVPALPRLTPQATPLPEPAQGGPSPRPGAGLCTARAGVGGPATSSQRSPQAAERCPAEGKPGRGGGRLPRPRSHSVKCRRTSCSSDQRADDPGHDSRREDSLPFSAPRHLASALPCVCSSPCSPRESYA